MRFAYTMNSSARASRIMYVWKDVKNWKKWDYHLEYARINGKFRKGATGTLKSKRGPETRFVVEDAEHNKVIISMKFPLARLKITRIVIPLRRGCTFMHETSFEGTLGFFYGLALGRRFRKELPIVMSKVRQIAEK